MNWETIQHSESHWQNCWLDHHACCLVALLNARREAETVRDELARATERPGQAGTQRAFSWEERR